MESLRRRWALYFLVFLLGAAVLWYFAGWMILRTIQQATWHGGSMTETLRLLLVSGCTTLGDGLPPHAPGRLFL